MHVYYSEHASVVGVEVFNPGFIVCDGFEILPGSIGGLESCLEDDKYNFTYDSYGINRRDLGLRSFSNNFERGNAEVSIDVIYVDLDVGKLN